MVDKNKTEIVLIVDKSGSMSNLASDCIGGINSFVEEQKKVAGEATLSLILFSDAGALVTIQNRVPVKEFAPLSESTYRVGGLTALYDAIGYSVDNTGRILSEMKEEERPGQVIFVIFTDGMENSSVCYSYSKIKEMIETQKNTYNWKFMFMGCGDDILKQGSDVGVTYCQSYVPISGDQFGVKYAYQMCTRAVTEMRNNTYEDNND